MVRGVTIAMVVGEPMLVFWRAKDLARISQAYKTAPASGGC